MTTYIIRHRGYIHIVGSDKETILDDISSDLLNDICWSDFYDGDCGSYLKETESLLEWLEANITGYTRNEIYID